MAILKDVTAAKNKLTPRCHDKRPAASRCFQTQATSVAFDDVRKQHGRHTSRARYGDERARTVQTVTKLSQTTTEWPRTVTEYSDV